MFTYQIGEIMVHLTAEEAQKYLEKQEEQVKEELKELYSNIESIQKVMSNLKVQLYAKFGDNINPARSRLNNVYMYILIV